MKVMHDKIVHLGFGGYGSHAARIFTGKVPKNHHFLTEDPARLIPVRFVDIWNIFNLRIISLSMLRIWALYEDNSHSLAGRKNMVDCLVAAMVIHTETPYLLVPYRQW
jgi:hypothetical protein